MGEIAERDCGRLGSLSHGARSLTRMILELDLEQP